METWEEFLKTVTYKKDYKFHYNYAIDFDVRRIVVTVMTEDTYNPGKPLRVDHNYPVPPFDVLGEEGAQSFLRNIIHSVECHESDEWLKFNGEMVFDPHAN